LIGYLTGKNGGVSFDTFQRLAGALHAETHGGDGDLSIIDRALVALHFKTYGTAPYYGEVVQQYRWSKYGYDHGSKFDGLMGDNLRYNAIKTRD